MWNYSSERSLQMLRKSSDIIIMEFDGKTYSSKERCRQLWKMIYDHPRFERFAGITDSEGDKTADKREEKEERIEKGSDENNKTENKRNNAFRKWTIDQINRWLNKAETIKKYLQSGQQYTKSTQSPKEVNSMREIVQLLNEEVFCKDENGHALKTESELGKTGIREETIKSIESFEKRLMKKL